MKKGAPGEVASPDSGPTGALDSQPLTLPPSSPTSARPRRNELEAGNPQPPQVPDHELLRCIGRGSYGEVWLARSVLGEYRAVKVIHRRAVGDNRPFEREFEGIQRYEPISRSHESQVQILHVGINQAAGYFYYVMELADEAGGERSDGAMERWSDGKAAVPRPSTTPILQDSNRPLHHATTPPLQHPASYVPRTLRHDLQTHGRLPLAQCLEIGLALTTALAHLHKQGLVHRDIKPSNIIFVKGRPKLADIGLVTDVGDAQSIVGTEGYLAPEGPGTVQADIYALGMVLYEISTGRDRRHFPDLPLDLAPQSAKCGTRNAESTSAAPQPTPHSALRTPHLAGLLELNEILLKACARDARQRYQSAEEMQADLELLRVGKSVKQRHASIRRWMGVRKLAVLAVILAALGVVSDVIKNEFPRQRAVSRSSGTLFETSGTQSREAYNYYRQGIFQRDRAEDDAVTNAVACFEKAIQADPKFARAYAGLADCYLSMADGVGPPHVMQEKQREAALKALALDDSLAEAHCVLAFFKRTFEWDWTGAEHEFKRALELDPNSARAHKYYAEFLSIMSRHDEAIREAQRAVAANPTWAEARDIHGYVLYCARQFDRAVEVFRESAETDPHYAVTYYYLNEVYSHLNRFDEAAATILRAVEVEDAGKNWPGVQRYREARQQGGWLGIKRLRVSRWLARPPEIRDDYFLAIDYVQLGEKVSALGCLERGAETRSPHLSEIGVNPTFDPLRSEPRFQALLRKMGLEK